MYLPAFGKTNCVYLVGDGNFFKPQIETRFIKNYQDVKKSWDDCSEEKKLISLGSASFIYNSNSNKYEKIPKNLVDDEASRDNFYDSIAENIQKLNKGDTLKLYLGDHGYIGGTLASDGIIKASELQKLLKLGQSKGIKFEGVFDHCYSGNMLSSYYDLNTYETYGCAMSTANDKVSYVNEDITDEDTIYNKTILSQAFLGDKTKKTFLLATSDRFLLDYAKKHVLKDESVCCDFNKIEQSYGFNNQSFDKIAYKDVFDEIKRLETNLKRSLNNADGIYSKDDYSWRDPNGSANAWDFYGKILRDTRKAFLIEAAKDPAWNIIFAEKDKHYESLVDCRDSKKTPVATDCPGYKEYTKLKNRIEIGVNDFNDKTDVKTVFGKAQPFGKAYNNKKLSDLIEGALKRFNHSRIYEQFNEKKELYATKKLALLLMMKKNDTKAIKAFMELRSCEKNTSL